MEDSPGSCQKITSASKHGLAHVVPPSNLTIEEFIDAAWTYLIGLDEGFPVGAPEWLDDPAFSKLTITSPHTLRPFRRYNAEQQWTKQIKPFNFMLVAHVAPDGYPTGVDPAKFRLVAPYTTDRSQWIALLWRNLYEPDGHSYRVSTTPHDALNGPRPSTVADVMTYRTLLHRYRQHPESKYADDGGKPCAGNTRGLLHRCNVSPQRIAIIGKETNELDDVNAGLYGTLDEVKNTYRTIDVELAEALAVTAHLSGRQLAQMLGVDRRTVDRIRNGATPRENLRRRLLAVAQHVSAGAHG